MQRKCLPQYVKSPCKNCEESHRACWSECEKYKQFCIEKEEKKAERYKDINMAACTYEFDQITKRMRWKVQNKHFKMR